MKTSVILLGCQNEVVELCEDCGLTIVCIVDSRLALQTSEYMGYPLISEENDFKHRLDELVKFPMVMTPQIPADRRRNVQFYSAAGFEFASLISPEARISRTAVIGTGAVIHPGAGISVNTRLGDFVKVNARAYLAHDCQIGGYTTVAPRAVLLGGTVTEEDTYIGANATILPCRRIGENAIVGAGAVVTRDIPPGKTAKGVPARFS